MANEPEVNMELLKVPASELPSSDHDAVHGPSTGSPADALHPERTAAILAGVDPDDVKAREKALADFQAAANADTKPKTKK